MKYDYIIAGSGCAGLSLLYSLLQSPSLQSKSILVIDQAPKNNNDRTWCFWEKTPGLFESIVHAKWNTLEFLATDLKKELNLESYTYKMILGLDFYNFVLDYAQQFENVTFLQETVTGIDAEDAAAIVRTSENSYTGTYVFNSTQVFNPKITEQNSLLQHFKGWVIQSEKPVFNPKVGRLMDFSVSQKQGATFMYVLPTSTTEALVEYTLFSPRVLAQATYVSALKKYIKEDLNIDNYTIKHEEFGVYTNVISEIRKKLQNPHVVNLGTAGGFTKASSGYTFQFIQKNVAEIVGHLEAGKHPNLTTSFKDKVYQWYDRTLLDVLLTKKLTGKEVFTRIFQKIPAKKILAFLGNESSFAEDISIMNSLPLKPFLGSGIKQL